MTMISAVAKLECLIDSGAFAPRAKPDIEQEKRARYSLYASCVESVARGILTLARAKNGALVDISAFMPIAPTLIRNQWGPRSKFIVFNTRAPGLDCTRPTGNSTFGSSAELGLRAVILETGYSYDGPKTELSLVLPAWGTGRCAPGPNDFVIARLDTTGHSGGDRFSPCAHTDEGSESFTDADAFLRHLLGMEPIERLAFNRSINSIDQAIGFPGAEDYLAAKLPELGDYFTALAEKFSSLHEH